LTIDIIVTIVMAITNATVAAIVDDTRDRDGDRYQIFDKTILAILMDIVFVDGVVFVTRAWVHVFDGSIQICWRANNFGPVAIFIPRYSQRLW